MCGTLFDLWLVPGNLKSDGSGRYQRYTASRHCSRDCINITLSSAAEQAHEKRPREWYLKGRDFSAMGKARHAVKLDAKPAKKKRTISQGKGWKIK